MNITLGLVILTTLISLAALNNHELNARLIFNPYIIKNRKEWYRFVTCGFLHADYLHLFVNMFVLYNFGPAVEHFYKLMPNMPGQLLYLVMYILGIAAANVTTYKKHQHNPGYNALGASGAVSAVLFSFALFAPFSTIAILGIIPMPTILAAVIYLFYSWQMGRKEGDNINHEAHFYGAVFGITFTLAVFPRAGILFYEQVMHQIQVYL